MHADETDYIDRNKSQSIFAQRYQHLSADFLPITAITAIPVSLNPIHFPHKKIQSSLPFPG
jgi:hypothetical protein